MNIFEHNAAELVKLHDKVHETWRHRGESPQRKASWQEAARRFHAAYDELAFPGGLTRHFELLKADDPTAIEMSVRFLEANPWYFGSGYHKATFLEYLRKHPLTDDLCARLRKVIIERIHDRHSTREFRHYARLALCISTPEFESELVAISINVYSDAARHARWVLEYLKQAKASRLK